MAYSQPQTQIDASLGVPLALGSLAFGNALRMRLNFAAIRQPALP